MIAFASYVDSSEDFSQSFSDWLKVRPTLSSRYIDLLDVTYRQGLKSGSKHAHISMHTLSKINKHFSQVKFLRKSYGSRLNVFSPVNDLSSLSKSGFQDRSLVPGRKNYVAIAGGQVLGDEYSDHVVKVNNLAVI